MNKCVIFNIIILVIFNISGCSNKKPSKEQLFDADLRFSAMSVEKGFPAAFAAFAHPDAVILRRNSMPVKGKTAITNLYNKTDTNAVVFTWEPLDGDISKSGELGYTYGTYTFKKDTLVERGTYVSVWKKDESGNWKYILDTGNEGLGE